MGVYIKGMEMPESCLECPFKWAGDSTTYCLAQTPTMKSLMPVKLHEIRWKKFSNAVEKFRWKEASCPLVPVPPHGRLIDADAFAAEMKKRQDACAAWRDDIKNGGGYGTELYYRADSFSGAMCETKLTLDKIPTIIPAEEGE